MEGTFIKLSEEALCNLPLRLLKNYWEFDNLNEISVIR
jgi:hypothetical protein